MATAAQKKEFINRVAPLAQKAYRQFGKPLPSICIAMAAVECNWGLAGSCKYNSYLGQKVGTGKTATKYWSGKYFNSKTQEVINQSTGQLVTIKDNFRAYDSVEQCIFNYYELLNTSLYKRVLAGSGYREQMQQIKVCGYMTSITEVNTCINIIGQNNLVRFDSIVPADSTENIGDTPIYRAGGTYTTQVELKVRTGPGTDYPAKNHSQLTQDGKKHDMDKDGALDQGTKVTCKKVIQNGEDVWIETPSGWIAAYYRGKVYVM